MTDKTLWEIGDDMAALDATLFEMGGELPDEEVEKIIDAWILENKDRLANKLDDYFYVIAMREALAAGRKAEAQRYQAEADRLKALAQTDENQVKRMKERIKLFFEARNIKRFETAHHKFTVSGNGGMKPLVYPEAWKLAPESAPERFHKTRIDLDTDGIRFAIEDGEKIEGCKLDDRGTHLRIR